MPTKPTTHQTTPCENAFQSTLARYAAHTCDVDHVPCGDLLPAFQLDIQFSVMSTTGNTLAWFFYPTFALSLLCAAAKSCRILQHQRCRLFRSLALPIRTICALSVHQQAAANIHYFLCFFFVGWEQEQPSFTPFPRLVSKEQWQRAAALLRAHCSAHVVYPTRRAFSCLPQHIPLTDDTQLA